MDFTNLDSNSSCWGVRFLALSSSCLNAGVNGLDGVFIFKKSNNIKFKS